MRLNVLGRLLLVFIAVIGLLAVPACQTREEPAAAPRTSTAADHATSPALPKASTQAASEPLKDEIPPSELTAVMTAHFKGLGLMEQYEYRKAAEAFREIRTRAPGWIPGSINLAIALLNDSGVQAEAAKKAGGGAARSNFDEALQILAGVLKREPDNRHAHFCRGIILEQQGDLAEAHKHFKRVTELDPHDASSWYWSRSTLTDPDDPTQPAGPRQAKEQVALYSKALACDPYLTPAIYKLSFALSSRGSTRQAERAPRALRARSTPIARSPCPDPATRRKRFTARWASTPRRLTPSVKHKSRGNRPRSRPGSSPPARLRCSSPKVTVGQPRMTSKASTPPWAGLALDSVPP